ncbi:MAG: hypothetical protein EOS25_12240 [Mesorhizobium sp.]|uniref:hypothetical protein n=1 Tax=Mesorhizobium sp. TaxID=1871066 RepID=UPI000FE5AAB8|nr:hypothetical protein [Mesorhizobium sp.]RWD50308.1 MAG: hypothetical protein EOS59_09995 [Mesorhizobium sp.]RWE63458.1 MAG: hypothetical protein EOS24_03825 [Mesorhizobium sp.]RWF11321.1 MAG: hypothetical protein EOS69_10610 [Mesorhizobium sp.]RWF18946.1 MAG: hypothetical protein EOS25_12240 [Mesorhizobium sp.]TIT58107.1 MAG: hypothetical protein E5W90_37055 [Mesorhizobium sp.]
MVTKLQDTKAVKGSSDEHGGNRGGNQEKKDKPQKSSQAAGRDPNRGEDSTMPAPQADRNGCDPRPSIGVTP